MAERTTTQVTSKGGGTDVDTGSAAAVGDSFGRYADHLVFRNADAAPHTVTVSTGVAGTLPAITVPAGGRRIINVRGHGGGTVSYDAVTSMFITVVQGA